MRTPGNSPEHSCPDRCTTTNPKLYALNLMPFANLSGCMALVPSSTLWKAVTTSESSELAMMTCACSSLCTRAASSSVDRSFQTSLCQPPMAESNRRIKAWQYCPEGSLQ